MFEPIQERLEDILLGEMSMDCFGMVRFAAPVTANEFAMLLINIV
jgi:hypothetical protein